MKKIITTTPKKQQITQSQIKKMIDAHYHYLNGDLDKGSRFECDKNFNYKSLSFGDKNLRSAMFGNVNLSNSMFHNTDLHYTNFYKSNLSNCDFDGANLSGADLTLANLTDANLSNVSLEGTVLTGVNLKGTILPPFQIVPDEGQFVGWKKVEGGIILKLLILESAERTSSLIGRKCRASKVKVLKAFKNPEINNVPLLEKGEFKSYHDASFIYRVGKYAEALDYSDDIRIECASGIHFFITRKEAENY